MADVNVELLNASIHHAVDLQRYSSGAVKKMIGILNKADVDLTDKLAAALERLPAESFTVKRLDKMLSSVKDLNAQIYDAFQAEMESESKDLVQYESDYQHNLFKATLPIQLSIASVTADSVYTAAMAQPFQGKLMSEWSTGLSSDRYARILSAVRMGYISGETTPQIMARIRGTKANKYADGLMEIDRRNADAVVRTAISHMAGFTRDRFYEANSDIVQKVMWLSTLDGRTTMQCQARDRHLYSLPDHSPLDGGPSWMAGPGRVHWRCRSTSTPITASWKELGIDMPEFSGTRASMDGQVPGSISYGDWLKGKGEAFQDELLGPSRGKLFRAGMPVEKFVDRAGNELTLAQLRERDAALFDKAGLSNNS